MLRFAEPLTAAATEIVVWCLEISSDTVGELSASPDDWREAFPLSATCFTPELARVTLVDLLKKLQLPEEYMPTEYHWLLLYECLQMQIEVLNDMPLPHFVKQLKTLATDDDEVYLSLPTRARGTAGFQIDFDALLDKYFWDTDFLIDPEHFSQLSPDAKAHLGFTDTTFGVVQGLSPHPDELVLRKSEEIGNESEQEEG